MLPENKRIASWVETALLHAAPNQSFRQAILTTTNFPKPRAMLLEPRSIIDEPRASKMIGI